jgi:hypothetical protein
VFVELLMEQNGTQSSTPFKKTPTEELSPEPVLVEPYYLIQLFWRKTFKLHNLRKLGLKNKQVFVLLA